MFLNLSPCGYGFRVRDIPGGNIFTSILPSFFSGINNAEANRALWAPVDACEAFGAIVPE